MANKYHGGAGIKGGQTSVTIPIRLLSTAGAAVTGKVYSDLTAYYWRQGGSPTAITLSALAAINSAYSSGGVKEAEATNMKGLYRLDLPDAMLAVGVDWVVLQVQCSGAVDYPVFIPLETVGDAENYDVVSNGTYGNSALKTSLDTIDDYIDTEVAAIKAKTDQFVFTTTNRVDATTASGGVGAYAKTIRINDSSNNPVDGAEVWVTTDSAGNNVSASGTTDSAGNVTVMLDAGSFFVFAQRSGINFPTTGTVLTVP